MTTHTAEAQPNGIHDTQTNQSNQPTDQSKARHVSYLFRNVHFFKGQEMVTCFGDIYVSGKDGRIAIKVKENKGSQGMNGNGTGTEETSDLLIEGEEGEIISEVIGGGDHEYLIMPALRNMIDFTNTIKPGHVTQFPALVRYHLERAKQQGVSNITLKMDGAKPEERNILETCLKESGLKGHVITNPEQQQKELGINDVTFRENLIRGIPNPEFSESVEYNINTGNVLLTSSDIWTELNTIALHLVNKKDYSCSNLLLDCFRGSGKSNVIDNTINNNCKTDLIIIKLDHSLSPFTGATNLLLKAHSSMVHGLIVGGKMLQITNTLNGEITQKVKNVKKIEGEKTNHVNGIENGLNCEFDSVEEALVEFAKGNFVVVVDNEDRENEGDLIMAAEFVTEEKMAFLIRHTSGLVCIATTRERLDQLELPLMVEANNESFKTAFTVSVDYVHGTTTGISAHDRALTARAFANKNTKPQDLNRPGHMFPLRYATGGVLTRMGHTEATVDLCKLSGLYPAGILCEVALDNGKMARRDYLRNFANFHHIKMITISDMIKYRKAHHLEENF